MHLRTHLHMTAVALLHTCVVIAQGEFTNFARPYVYFIIILNLSQFWAMYCLVMFYRELKDQLAPLRPFGKFLCVKAVVFFSFWQQMLISGLVFVNVIKPTLTYTKDDVSKGLQDFVICIEMALAAIVHRYYFSYQDFNKPDVVSHHGAARALKEMLPMDMVQDAAHHWRSRFGLRSTSTTNVYSTPAGNADAGPMDGATSAAHELATPMLASHTGE
ncbi:OSTA/TMEM184 family protein [archaeon]|nr:MAG: OSTA/TMEM184 family protein [archaeon]